MSANILKDFVVIGDPISHSLSPRIHGAMLSALNIDLNYGKIQVERGKLSQFFESEEFKNLRGFNITMPHKYDIIQYLKEVSLDAKAINAVNTVVIKDSGLYGYNTDCVGFISALKSVNVSIKDKEILILGKGGASKAVAYGLQQEGGKVSIACRNAENLKKQNLEFFKDIYLIDWSNFHEKLNKIDILINATPLGMEGVGEDFENFSFLDLLPKNAFVCDLIYKPLETQLLAIAKEKGFKTQNGLAMLIHQAIVALEFFLNTPLDRQAMEKVVFSELLKEE